MLDAFLLEKRGVPTLTVCHDRFEVPARMHAKALGMPSLPLLIEPVPTGGSVTHDTEALAKLVDTHLDQILHALTGARASIEPSAR